MGVGPPQRLKILQFPSTMWAGNQPFHQQPKITMVDSGGNIIQSDSITEIRAYTVTSLAQNSDIIVDTSTDPIPRIISVQFHESIINGSKMVFSPGDRIPVSVQFSSDVSVTLQSSSNYSNPVPPMLTLNVNDGSPFSFAKAVFLGSEGHTSKVLTFEYTVYDVHNQFPVNYLNITALHSNDYIITDGWNRTVLLSLPGENEVHSLKSSRKIAIQNHPAIITNVLTSTISGEYGAGHQINFEVDFSLPVSLSIPFP